MYYKPIYSKYNPHIHHITPRTFEYEYESIDSPRRSRSTERRRGSVKVSKVPMLYRWVGVYYAARNPEHNIDISVRMLVRVYVCVNRSCAHRALELLGIERRHAVVASITADREPAVASRGWCALGVGAAADWVAGWSPGFLPC